VPFTARAAILGHGMRHRMVPKQPMKKMTRAQEWIVIIALVTVALAATVRIGRSLFPSLPG